MDGREWFFFCTFLNSSDKNISQKVHCIGPLLFFFFFSSFCQKISERTDCPMIHRQLQENWKTGCVKLNHEWLAKIGEVTRTSNDDERRGRTMSDDDKKDNPQKEAEIVSYTLQLVKGDKSATRFSEKVSRYLVRPLPSKTEKWYT